MGCGYHKVAYQELVVSFYLESVFPQPVKAAADICRIVPNKLYTNSFTVSIAGPIEQSASVATMTSIR
jgi:hypothetical protein